MCFRVGVQALAGLTLSRRGSGVARPGNVWVGSRAGVWASWGRRLPVPHRNMALLLRGLLLLGLSCLQGPCLVVSLGLGQGGAGRQVGPRRRGSGVCVLGGGVWAGRGGG